MYQPYDVDIAIEDCAKMASVQAFGEAQEVLTKLITKIKECTASKSPESVKLILYFDEAHSLILKTGDGQSRNLLNILYSSLDDLREETEMVTIFLSTNSRMATLARPQSMASSARICHRSATLHPPITEMPFDHYPGLRLEPQTLRLKDLDLSYMARFGRPL